MVSRSIANIALSVGNGRFEILNANNDDEEEERFSQSHRHTTQKNAFPLSHYSFANNLIILHHLMIFYSNQVCK
jgi:hypothetical protein